MVKEQKYTLWYNQLVCPEGKWKLSGDLFNLLPDSTLEAPLGVYDLYNPLDNFDICEAGVAFTATDLTRSAFEPEQVSFAYFAPLDSFDSPPNRGVFQIQTPSSTGVGIATNIHISPDATQVAFLHNDYSDPCNNKILVADFDNGVPSQVAQILTGYAGSRTQDPPFAFEFYEQSRSFILQRIEAGRVVVSTLQQGNEAEDVLKCTQVGGLCPRDSHRDTWLLTTSSFVERIRWTLFDIPTKQEIIIKSTHKSDQAQFGVAEDMISEFHCHTEEADIHSWMIRPRGFSEDKIYPWIMLPHGGPESAWMNSWSTRVSALFWIFALTLLIKDGSGTQLCSRNRATLSYYPI